MAETYTEFVDETLPRHLLTVVRFPQYMGWRVFACSGPSQFMLSLVLVESQGRRHPSGAVYYEKADALPRCNRRTDEQILNVLDEKLIEKARGL